MTLVILVMLLVLSWSVSFTSRKEQWTDLQQIQFSAPLSYCNMSWDSVCRDEIFSRSTRTHTTMFILSKLLYDISNSKWSLIHWMEILVTFQSHSVRLYWVSWFKPIYTNSSKNRWPFNFCRLKIMQAYFIIGHGRELSLHDHLLWCAILLNMKAVKTNTSMKGRHNVNPRFFVSSTKPPSKLCFCNIILGGWGSSSLHLCNSSFYPMV